MSVVPPICKFSPIPTPPTTFNAPVVVDPDVVLLLIDVIPATVKDPLELAELLLIVTSEFSDNEQLNISPYMNEFDPLGAYELSIYKLSSLEPSVSNGPLNLPIDILLFPSVLFNSLWYPIPTL